MIVQVIWSALMKLASTFLPRRDEPWMPFLLLEQPLYSTFKGQYTKVVIAVERRSKFLLIFPLQETGDGLTPITGNHCGLPDLKQANHPGSYCAVAARKGAEGSASAKEQL